MKRVTMLAVAVIVILTGGARAAGVEVKLLNKGSDGGMMVFEPAYLKIAAGDTVKFLSAGSGYDANSIKDMLPDGATPLVGRNGADLAVRFDREGVYGVKCLPHRGICMVLMVSAPASAGRATGDRQDGKADTLAMLPDKAGKTAPK